MKIGTTGALGIVAIGVIGVLSNITDPNSTMTNIELVLCSLLVIMMASIFAELFNDWQDMISSHY